MFTLSYSNAYDPYHTIFRFVCALKASERQTIRYEKLRFIDFYLCFPWLIVNLKGMRNIPGFIKMQNAVIKKYAKNPYEMVPAQQSLFERMEPIQLAACSAMISDGVIEDTQHQRDAMELIENRFTPKLEARIQNYLEERSDLLEFLTKFLVQIDVDGPNGLKYRTGLGEYRYDDV